MKILARVLISEILSIVILLVLVIGGQIFER